MIKSPNKFTASWQHDLKFISGNELVKNLLSYVDGVFCLDFSSLIRIGELGELIRESNTVKVLIDHHIDPEDFADFVLHDDEASSTCELIYRFIKLFEDLDKIDKYIGECIYAGIMTDTGSFKYASIFLKMRCK